MVTIFDLDDTLYDELSYVHSGFRAVAAWGEARLGLDAQTSCEELLQRLAAQGRGRLFDGWLRGRATVREAVRAYRHHDPCVRPWPSAIRVLDALAGAPLYLVTDGHKVVQAKKLQALGLAPRFRHAYLTHRYGIAHAKPSTHCFELIARRERCDLRDLVYVADNPAKDFVNLNARGACTVRVLTGQHRDAAARPGFDARHRIAGLDELPSLLASLAP
ncbi:MAG: HAD family hydrolase [Rubrivivax sp.]|nr:HAD family hydrolase [Rubrivivax sp.]